MSFIHVCISYFSWCCDKILDESYWNKSFLLDYIWRGYFGLYLEVMAVAEVWGSQSHCVCFLVVERDEFSWLPPSFFFFSMEQQSTLVSHSRWTFHPLWKHHHRHTKKCSFQFTPTPVKMSLLTNTMTWNIFK